METNTENEVVVMNGGPETGIIKTNMPEKMETNLNNNNKMDKVEQIESINDIEKPTKPTKLTREVKIISEDMPGTSSTSASSHSQELAARRRQFMSQPSTVASRRQQAVCVRRAHKNYGAKKNPNVVLDGLNMTVPKGSMYVCKHNMLTHSKPIQINCYNE